MKNEYSTLELRVQRSSDVADSQTLREMIDEWGMNIATQESVWVVAYDANLNIRRVVEVARGSYHEVDVSIPAVMSAVLVSGTDRFIVVHNHPSGAVQPSVGDMDMTTKIMKAANACGLRFDDHVIVGPNDAYFSMTDKGYIVPSGISARAKAAAHGIRANPSTTRFLHRL